jgi:hypothetical protein
MAYSVCTLCVLKSVATAALAVLGTSQRHHVLDSIM